MCSPSAGLDGSYPLVWMLGPWVKPCSLVLAAIPGEVALSGVGLGLSSFSPSCACAAVRGRVDVGLGPVEVAGAESQRTKSRESANQKQRVSEPGRGQTDRSGYK